MACEASRMARQGPASCSSATARRSGAGRGSTPARRTFRSPRRAARAARALGERLAGRALRARAHQPDAPRARHRRAGRASATGAEVTEDLHEVAYGSYEGRTTPEIREERPGWDLWHDGTPDGEPLEAAGARADRVIARALAADGDVALVAHGHILRVLGARWIGLPATAGGSARAGHRRALRARLRARAARHLALERHGRLSRGPAAGAARRRAARPARRPSGRAARENARHGRAARTRHRPRLGRRARPRASPASCSDLWTQLLEELPEAPGHAAVRGRRRRRGAGGARARGADARRRRCSPICASSCSRSRPTRASGLHGLHQRLGHRSRRGGRPARRGAEPERRRLPALARRRGDRAAGRPLARGAARAAAERGRPDRHGRRDGELRRAQVRARRAARPRRARGGRARRSRPAPSTPPRRRTS